MKIRKDIPEYLHPIIEGLQAKAEQDREAVGYGVIDTMPISLSRPDSGEIGISFGMGHWSIYSVNVNKNLYGDRCCTASFRNGKKITTDEGFEGAKAYFEVQDKTQEVVEEIWDYLVSGIVPDSAAIAPFEFKSNVEPGNTATIPQLCAITKSMRDDILSGKLEVPNRDDALKDVNVAARVITKT